MIEFLVTHAKLGSLLLFFSFFVLMLVWLYRPGAKQVFNRYAQIALEDDDDSHR